MRVYHLTFLWVTFARSPGSCWHPFLFLHRFPLHGESPLVFYSIFPSPCSAYNIPCKLLLLLPSLQLQSYFPGSHGSSFLGFAKRPGGKHSPSVSQKPPSHPLVPTFCSIVLLQCHPIDCSLCIPHPSFPVIFTLLTCTS